MMGVNLSRRTFLWSAGIVGGGLIAGISLLRSRETPPAMVQAEGAFEPNAFLQITRDNVVRFYCPRDEMGQGITTGLATLVAEELDVEPHQIEIALVGAHTEYNNPAFGAQGTGGSTSMRAHFLPLRQLSANVRAAIIEAAATDLEVPASSLHTENAHVVVDGKHLPYGQFVRTAGGSELPSGAPLKPKRGFKYIGKDFPRLDGIAKSTGTAIFGIDVDLPNLHYAVVKHSPVAGGSVKAVDKAAALAMPGVTDVVTISYGVAVVAKKFWQAKKAAQVLEVTWDLPHLASLSSADLKADYTAALARDDGDSTETRGDVEAAFKSAANVVESVYWAPFLAHAPMEPMNAVVRIENGEADIWSGTQSPASAQGLVARFSGVPKEKVRVHSTYLGGGFGRRGTLTHIVEATETAVAAGKPIKVLWTREDDIQNGYFRPASLIRIKAAINDGGDIDAWQAKRVGGNIAPWTFGQMLAGALPTSAPQKAIDWAVDAAETIFDGWRVDHSSIEGLYEDYDFPNREIIHATRDHGLPLTYWRSVGNSYTAFAKESAIDELAQLASIDAVDFRLQNTKNNPRLNNVIRLAGERMNAMNPPSGHALGVAAHGSFMSYVAEVAEVSVSDEGKIAVHHVLCVVDCGLVVNPDVVRAQMEGGIMFGLTAALYGNLEIDNGAIRESNFHDYPILRMHEAPSVEVIIVDSDEAPTGVGEPGLPPIAPAVANAVYAATGQRLRSLPLQVG